MIVSCRNLGKRYRQGWLGGGEKTLALQNVTFDINDATITGLVGANGAGKTTLLGLISGLIFPTEGHVAVGGHPARSLEARRLLGFMPERPAFIGRYSAKAVLRYHAGISGLNRSQIPREVDKLIEQVNLTEARNRPSYTFSQGMQQRLGLAIALVGNPKLLLLDEPSNGLDPAGIVELRDLLKTLRASGATILISSHRLSELEKLTNTHIFLDHGRMVSPGSAGSAGKGSLLRIDMLPRDIRIDPALFTGHEIVTLTETEALLAGATEDDIPEIVRRMVEGGAAIKGVRLETSSLEDVFMQLHKGGQRADAAL
jgi:ABC-2 type transport system ATP-binding protein